jgi:hypothetical protein
MSIYHLRFQPGQSLADFLLDFVSDAQCQAVLEQSRGPRGFILLATLGAARFDDREKEGYL